MAKWFLLSTLFFIQALSPCYAAPQVVINEVNQAGNEFLELYNPGDHEIDLRGYSLVGDISYIFTEKNDKIGAKGYFVMGLETPSSRRDTYDDINIWMFSRISNKRGQIKLRNPKGQLIDVVNYGQSKVGCSYQRIDPNTSYTGSLNWAYAKTSINTANENLGQLTLPCLDAPSLSPSQPTSKQAVEVSVRVFNPSEAKGVTVQWRSIPGHWQSAELKPNKAEAQFTTFAGQIPPQADQSLVYCRFVLTHGKQKQRLTIQPETNKALRFFVFDGLQTSHTTYCLQLPEESVKDLVYKPAKERFPAEFVEITKGQVNIIGPVKIQAKGGGWTMDWKKRNWLIRLPKGKFVDGQRFLTWRPNWYDTTCSRELLACKLYKMAGVPVSRVKHVRIQMNGQFFGLYTQVETVDEYFLARNGFGNGVLYKPTDGYKNRSDKDWCDGRRYKTLEDYAIRWEKKTYKEEPHTDLRDFIEGYHDCPPDKLKQYFDEHLDVDKYLRYLTINILLTHWDSTAKNYLWVYDRENSKKWVVIPWDLDQTWGKGMVNKATYVSSTVYYGTKTNKIGGWRAWWNHLRDKVLHIPAYRDRVYELINEFLNKKFLHQDFAKHVKLTGPERMMDLKKWGVYRSKEVDGLHVGKPYKEKYLLKDLAQIRFYIRAREKYLRKHYHRRAYNQKRVSKGGHLDDRSPSTPNLWLLITTALATVIYIALGCTKEDRL
jgi:spore coat protein CotH